MSSSTVVSMNGKIDSSALRLLLSDAELPFLFTAPKKQKSSAALFDFCGAKKVNRVTSSTDFTKASLKAFVQLCVLERSISSKWLYRISHWYLLFTVMQVIHTRLTVPSLRAPLKPLNQLGQA
ncbi:hypothetical protein OK016_25615 [Vibrio chagasii]|nr:hypothetical protein [Vibrio chagasii]